MIKKASEELVGDIALDAIGQAVDVSQRCLDVVAQLLELAGDRLFRLADDHVGEANDDRHRAQRHARGAGIDPISKRDAQRSGTHSTHLRAPVPNDARRAARLPCRLPAV